MNLLTTLLFSSLLLGSATANMGPPKPAKTISPSVLNDCGCNSFITMATRCQELSPTAFSTHNSCICTRSWYSTGMACRDCLMLADGQGDLPTSVSDFYTNLKTAIGNTFVACTNAGASVKVVDETHENDIPGNPGKGICGWNSYGGYACAGFDWENGTAWASSAGRDRKTVVVGKTEVEGLKEMVDKDVVSMVENNKDAGTKVLSSSAETATATATGAASSSSGAASAVVTGEGTGTQASASASASAEVSGALPSSGAKKQAVGGLVGLVGVATLFISA
ncbi:hypothetical protein FPQ18DRAFT_344947 [Pyronema domesticum]|nr:hypothetical protein FPQ18DRAFT_344947 [Pyronema domesticum]